MATQTQVFEHSNAMPAPTWHFLEANDATIPIAEGLAIEPDVHVLGPCEVGGDADADAFDHALARVQAQWDIEHPAPTADEIAEREAYLAAESDATYGGTAQSAYQKRADAIEEARSLAVAFEHGTGDAVASFLRDAAGRQVVVQASPGETVEANALINAAHGSMSAAAIDVIAMRGSTIDMSIVVDGKTRDADEAAAVADEAVGLTGTTLRVFADEGSCVKITRVQTLDDGFTDIDDMGLFVHEQAHVEVCQTVLGATTTFTGLAGDLRGDSACVNVETHYLGHDDQSHDFNYMLRHHGARTQCDMSAHGVLTDKSSKALRGTIDFVRGCKGAEGSEQETVLLVDEQVRNKTVPVILCNEDDVAGNHGATIGHIREEQLFYLESRGISRQAAEAMFVSAALEQAVVDAPNETARSAVLRLGERLRPGFTGLFEE